MDKFIITKVNNERYSTYHHIYSSNISRVSSSFSERVRIFDTEGTGYFIYNESNLIGGFLLSQDQVSNIFMIPPFDKRLELWKTILDNACLLCQKEEIFLRGISEPDAELLCKHFDINNKKTQKMMLRPTEQCEFKLNEHFYFSQPDETAIPEIVETVYEAHSAGFTSTLSKPDNVAIEKAIAKRFQEFSQTNSLHLSSLVRDCETHKLAGVCVAGIYPDSPNSFSTIHQVSVIPKYRSRGIAEAMIKKAINDACPISPVMTLTVMVGNPAEKLYHRLRFAVDKSSCDLVCIINA